MSDERKLWVVLGLAALAAFAPAACDGGGGGSSVAEAPCGTRAQVAPSSDAVEYD